jgi:hypothetical protein
LYSPITDHFFAASPLPFFRFYFPRFMQSPEALAHEKVA